MVKQTRKGKATVNEQFKRIDMAVNLMHGSEKEGYDKAISEVFAEMKKYEQKSFTENKTFIPETSYVILTWRAYQSLKRKFGVSPL